VTADTLEARIIQILGQPQAADGDGWWTRMQVFLAMPCSPPRLKETMERMAQSGQLERKPGKGPAGDQYRIPQERLSAR
jgi:hypothetical protein